MVVGSSCRTNGNGRQRRDDQRDFIKGMTRERRHVGRHSGRYSITPACLRRRFFGLMRDELLALQLRERVQRQHGGHDARPTVGLFQSRASHGHHRGGPGGRGRLREATFDDPKEEELKASSRKNKKRIFPVPIRPSPASAGRTGSLSNTFEAESRSSPRPRWRRTPKSSNTTRRTKTATINSSKNPRRSSRKNHKRIRKGQRRH